LIFKDAKSIDHQETIIMASEDHGEGHERRSFSDKLKHPFPELREKLKGMKFTPYSYAQLTSSKVLIYTMLK
jgi:hypothetical protein